ncbi:YbaB/EbfC DNA-binding family protein OS=Tsukamurella paurometabola (strain ATCC 8368 / DSM /CCUG 35730 / CIP 100753 / JCM 10117 / KCTC 9821 / NBRC 16120/ NCIMB 702349 / NCTC 13040) OX=521096 GN=Tpau_3377 PE=4 SV=1 [Tsukamurella paurometabola]|uniref:YbaB/EbfC DNA-binding family protein n=1 Tax=Tsukamurella paurometabola (strain ATCC 8368 / DSM 20162 / CCUG 35730 / CIP 100753 / JCM 10117 / KCTC 9821 / NBRC 16120 / NCIMB 702349 / NCTC 13040) TaxID=521096 RepID=D5UWG2_TSUPD|nr:hypothetical protein [Tsukamurella paurometabola]ADG79961.1 conserved hypothetical protein [Tsukamurella paurometabola DSM 20162]SUP37828.1 Uncharacterised protein [Tsukamurella paurometabola]
MSIATSTNGGLRVRANDQGTPLQITIEPGELRREPQELANAIVRLCAEAATSAGLARRAELERAGVAEPVLRALRLPEPPPRTPSAVVDEGIDSWLRRG